VPRRLVQQVQVANNMYNSEQQILDSLVVQDTRLGAVFRAN
jgi:hypothetical protein